MVAVSWRRTLALGLLGLLSIGAVLFLLLTGHGRLAFTLMLLELFVAIATVNVRAAILAVFFYLIVLGDLRRLLIPLFGWSGTDPLLMVGSVFALVVVAGALVNQEIRFDTKLAKWTLALMAIMVLQIFNPKQGGLMVGLAGAMFLIVPICWFWVGRTYATPALLRTLLYGLVLPMSLLAAIYGTYQVFFGYLPHQQRWLEMNWYAGLGDPKNPAPISLFASNTEYGKFLGIGAVLAWAAFLRGNRSAGLLVPPLLVAIALTGSRGPLFFSLAMMVGLWAVLARTTAVWVARGALAAVIAAVGLTWTLTRTYPARLRSTRAGPSRPTGPRIYSCSARGCRVQFDGNALPHDAQWLSVSFSRTVGVRYWSRYKSCIKVWGERIQHRNPFGK
jgi:hypothetical protein